MRPRIRLGAEKLVELYRRLRPFLFCLDPETAHDWSIRALGLKNALSPARTCPSPAHLRQRLFGLDFPNPVGLAAGYDKHAQVVDAALGLGFGFVEVGTVTPAPQEGNPRPRVFRLTEDEAIINRYGFNSVGHATAIDNLGRRKVSRGILGINIGANKQSRDRIGDYVSSYECFAPFADYITVNISSPNTPDLRNLQSQMELRPLLSALAQARAGIASQGKAAPPLLLKIAPDLSQPDLEALVEVSVEKDVDGLIISNTTISRPALKSSHSDQTGGLSGRPLRSLSTTVLASAYRLSAGRLPLIGVGGISSGQEAYDKITAGASLVQLYTALIFHGPGLVRRLADELAAIIKAEGFANISEAVGTGAERY